MNLCHYFTVKAKLYFVVKEINTLITCTWHTAKMVREMCSKGPSIV